MHTDEIAANAATRPPARASESLEQTGCLRTLAEVRERSAWGIDPKPTVRAGQRYALQNGSIFITKYRIGDAWDCEYTQLGRIKREQHARIGPVAFSTAFLERMQAQRRLLE